MKTKPHDPTYWVFTQHDGYVSFRSDSGFTGSTPNSLIPGTGGIAGQRKAHALARSFGLKRAQYEVLDGTQPRKNPRPRALTTAQVAAAHRFPATFTKPRKKAKRNPVLHKSVMIIRKGEALPYIVERMGTAAYKAKSRAWWHLARFATAETATEYANAYHAKHGGMVRIRD